MPRAAPADRRAAWQSGQARRRRGTPPRDPAGLDAHGDDRGPLQLGHEHQRVAPVDVPERAELVSRNEHQAGSDAEPAEVVEHPSDGVGLVGEPDLDVFDVARHAGVGEARLSGRGDGERDDIGQAGDPRRSQARVDRGEQLVDDRLRGVAPRGLGDEVDLPAVHAPGHQLCPQSSFRQLRDRPGGCRIEGGILCRGGLPAPDEPRTPASTAKTSEPRFRARCRAAGGPELAVDVPDVGAAHDDHVHAGAA